MHKITPETCSDSINIHIGDIIVNSFIKLNSLKIKGFLEFFYTNVFYFYIM